MLKSFLTASLLCLSATAENPAKPVPSKPEVKAGVQFGAGAEEIYRKSHKAQGLDKLAAMKGLEMQSSFEMVGLGMKGSASLLSTQDKAQLQTHMATLKFVQVFDGKDGWSSDPMFGERKLEGAEFFQLQQYTLKNMAEAASLWDKIELSEIKEFNGKACVTLKYSKKDMEDLILHLDKESFLPIGMVTTQVSPQGKDKLTTEITDYAQTPEGYHYASKMTILTGAMTMKLSTSCEKREAIDPASFAKPAAPVAGGFEKAIEQMIPEIEGVEFDDN